MSTRTTTSSVPLGVWEPDQHLADVLHDPHDHDRHGLLLHPSAWVGESPVVTLPEFERFVYANRANDHNGDWGRVTAHNTSDAGRCMLYIGADQFASTPMADWPAEGCTVAEVEAVWGAQVWQPGDGGTYRLADCPGWDEWAPITLPEREN